MKKLITVSVFTFLCLNMGFSQLGLSVGYVQYDAPSYSENINALVGLDANSKNFEQGTIQYAVDYWFRLPKKRIEFMPEVSYYQTDAIISQTTGIDAASEYLLTLNAFQLNFNTNIYPFDFAGDCDCPTFSKDGDILKKGFFIRLAPGMAVHNFKDQFSEVTLIGSSVSEFSAFDVGLSLRAGIGLDIGVSDFFTITPIAQYTYTSPTGAFNYFSDSGLGVRIDQSPMSQLFFGLRLGFRFDELNKYGYR